jgi:hypothetical protein
MQGSSRIEKAVPHFNLAQINNSLMSCVFLESFGGNTKPIVIDNKYYPCVTVNGYIETCTGRILAFGNPQDVDAEVSISGVEFHFVVAIDLLSAFSKIVSFVCSDKLPEHAAQAIAMTLEMYNSNGNGRATDEMRP